MGMVEQIDAVWSGLNLGGRIIRIGLCVWEQEMASKIRLAIHFACSNCARRSTSFDKGMKISVTYSDVAATHPRHTGYRMVHISKVMSAARLKGWTAIHFDFVPAWLAFREGRVVDDFNVSIDMGNAPPDWFRAPHRGLAARF